jgi:hypothetical protein
MSEKIHGLDVVVLLDGRMDRKSAAIYTGLSVKTLAMYASRGTGPTFVKRGRVWYFKHDLDSWLEAGRVSSSAQSAYRARQC